MRKPGSLMKVASKQELKNRIAELEAKLAEYTTAKEAEVPQTFDYGIGAKHLGA